MNLTSLRFVPRPSPVLLVVAVKPILAEGKLVVLEPNPRTHQLPPRRKSELIPLLPRKLLPSLTGFVFTSEATFFSAMVILQVQKSKKGADISAPPPETSSVSKWGDPHLKLPGKWPKSQEGMLEQDPTTWQTPSLTFVTTWIPKCMKVLKASPSTSGKYLCLHGIIGTWGYGHPFYWPSLKISSMHQMLREASSATSKCDCYAAKCLSCSNNLPKNGLNAFLEVAAQNSMSMIERLLTEIDFHCEQIFDIDLHLEYLKKKTVTAHKISQDTLKACCQDSHCIIHLLKTTDTPFKMTPTQVDMLIACLGWESTDFNVEVSHTSEGEPVVWNLAEGCETVFPIPDSMAAVPGNPLSDPANLFSTEGDVQVAKSSKEEEIKDVPTAEEKV
ncbi:hypothetical protein L218DRAFT_951855 [Marasmius fiardii PR-910]|nr:hypothetical protein L218DRAFT_951855 [Marasmius fiardii PR-910]